MSNHHPLLPELAATSSTVERIAATLEAEHPAPGELEAIVHSTGLYSMYADVFVADTGQQGDVTAFTKHIGLWVQNCRTIEALLRAASVERDGDKNVQADIIAAFDVWFAEACQFAGMSNTNPATVDEQQRLFDEFHEQESMRNLTDLVGVEYAQLLSDAAEDSTTEQFVLALDQLREILETTKNPQEGITVEEIQRLLATLRGE
jgi:hypothetical protein